MRNLAMLVLGILLTAVPICAGAVAISVQRDAISGRVFDSATDHGIAGLSVRLLAPRAMKQPVRVTITDANGEFGFRGLTVGKYLLTLYRGTTLLYRREIDNSVATTFAVPLRSVPAVG